MKAQLKKFRKRLLIYMTHDVALPYFRLVRKGYDFPYSIKDLQHFKEGTVGRALYSFFFNNDLELLPHYEKHDVKHVVLGYPPTEEGEVSLQCFMLANGRITAPVIFSVLLGIVIMPESWFKFRKAWKRGRATPCLNKLNWFNLIPQPLSEVRKQIFLTSK
jgi:ubiquinone biosynthesis protein Coq4